MAILSLRRIIFKELFVAGLREIRVAGLRENILEGFIA